jgi:hypothetical protein
VVLVELGAAVVDRVAVAHRPVRVHRHDHTVKTRMSIMATRILELRVDQPMWSALEARSAEMRGELLNLTAESFHAKQANRYYVWHGMTLYSLKKLTFPVWLGLTLLKLTQPVLNLDSILLLLLCRLLQHLLLPILLLVKMKLPLLFLRILQLLLLLLILLLMLLLFLLLQLELNKIMKSNSFSKFKLEKVLT